MKPLGQSLKKNSEHFEFVSSRFGIFRNNQKRMTGIPEHSGTNGLCPEFFLLVFASVYKGLCKEKDRFSHWTASTFEQRRPGRCTQVVVQSNYMAPRTDIGEAGSRTGKARRDRQARCY